MKTKRKRKASENLDDDDENDKEISEITSKSIDKKFGKYTMCYFTPNETVPFDDLTAI